MSSVAGSAARCRGGIRTNNRRRIDRIGQRKLGLEPVERPPQGLLAFDLASPGCEAGELLEEFEEFVSGEAGLFDDGLECAAFEITVVIGDSNTQGRMRWVFEIVMAAMDVVNKKPCSLQRG
jgi:hypothetical protein